MALEGAWPPVVVGIDLARVSETRRSIDLFGSRFLKRVFTEAELAECSNGAAAAAERLAARIAAKEATIKVLRPASKWLDPRSIEVRRDRGFPELTLHGEASSLAGDAGLDGFSISLSHEGDYATAVVLAVRRDRTQ